MSDYLSRPDVQGHLKIMELLRKWDPIGVLGPGSDWPQDEYDGYSGAIVGKLDRGISETDLAAHLSSIAEEHMSLQPNRSKDLDIAKEMVSFWKEWKQRA